jgi:hypothetical protein
MLSPINVLPLKLGVVFAEVEMFGEVVLPFEYLNGDVVSGGKVLASREIEVSYIPRDRKNLQECKD